MSDPFISFIETQFPVSKLSKESYKERTGHLTQTLTGLGKWWGRKPLVLVRAVIIGLLLPISDDPKRDREIFLKIMTMDEDGLWQRKSKTIPPEELYNHLRESERAKWFDLELSKIKPTLKKDLSKEEKTSLQNIVFWRLTYDEKLDYCDRPEQITGPSESSWIDINAHLETEAQSLNELVQQLGERQFGRIPQIGDAFAGGGSVPFEAARLGCEAYGSDLNPVAALLTWAALNIIGGGKEVSQQIAEAQQQLAEAVDRQVTAWGIEHNEHGWRADAFFYCNEVICPECHWKVPLAASWVIGKRSGTFAKLIPIPDQQAFEIAVQQVDKRLNLDQLASPATVASSNLVCPHCQQKTPIAIIRGDGRKEHGLRLWQKSDFVPHPKAVFQERLYCIRWIETYVDNKGKTQTKRYFLAPDASDLEREQKVTKLLQERFDTWQEKGYVPSRSIEPGDETTRLRRERGWTHWHHLFSARQLLVIGLCFSELFKFQSVINSVACLLMVGRFAERNSKLCGVDPSRDGIRNTFANQALNTNIQYGVQGASGLSDYCLEVQNYSLSPSQVCATDARTSNTVLDAWITDPPYADAINYHELSEFFLAWYDKSLIKLFPNWYSDSKRALAITGRAEDFRKSMVECYRNLANHMPANGYQVVMFTHQDAGVWADLALILWASGLRVTAAWCIATETSSALKEGNYVQGTVLLVLRKQTGNDTAFLDEIYPKVELEVKRQLDSMLALEDEEDPNFGDTDYQLAAYAAALRVLTQYQNIEDIDIAYELSKPKKKGSDKSEIEKIIDQAVVIACDYLVPKGFDGFVWKSLTPEERFYLKGLDIESHGEYRTGAYQELARGFGVKDYKPFLESSKANQTRLKTATEFSTKTLSDAGFAASLVRNALFAIRETARNESTQPGKAWLRAEVRDYWNQRKNTIEILRYLSTMGFKIAHWTTDAKAAELLAGALENDSV